MTSLPFVIVVGVVISQWFFLVGTLPQVPSNLKTPVAQTMLIQNQVLNLNGIDSSGGLEHVACTTIERQDVLLALWIDNFYDPL
ncbi:hypothetical protein HAX54_043157 [Datura stramonium]|uniref:Uncharacterized protein n=1 Tax=Datura stramonium TaxID=4076 RepID=A0ABS8SNA0_DATST|nr:hypothetical protein [Datura stramonium]